MEGGTVCELIASKQSGLCQLGDIVLERPAGRRTASDGKGLTKIRSETRDSFDRSRVSADQARPPHGMIDIGKPSQVETVCGAGGQSGAVGSAVGQNRERSRERVRSA